MEVDVKRSHAVAHWRWDTRAPNTNVDDPDGDGDVRQIYLVPFEGCRPLCKMPGDDCSHIFESTHSLVRVIHDALKAHRGGVTLAGVEHWDISVDNIVVVGKGESSRGLLIDWELAKYDSDTEPRVYERTGTPWRFMAGRLCESPNEKRTVEDELESFALILLWIAGRYAHNDMSPERRNYFLASFDRLDLMATTQLVRLGHHSVLDAALRNKPFKQLMGEVMDVFSARYNSGEFLSGDEQRKIEDKRMRVESHEWLIGKLGAALQDEAWKAIKDPSRDKEQGIICSPTLNLHKKRKASTTLCMPIRSGWGVKEE